MATIHRIEPAYTPWSPSASGFAIADAHTDTYVGRHRRPETRRVLSLLRMFHRARHRR
jgi:hypothetical protein